MQVTTVVRNEDLYLAVVNMAKERNESCVDLWKYRKDDAEFALHDVFYVVGPRSVSSVTYKGQTYLAIASGFVKNTMYSGLIDVKR